MVVVVGGVVLVALLFAGLAGEGAGPGGCLIVMTSGGDVGHTLFLFLVCRRLNKFHFFQNYQVTTKAHLYNVCYYMFVCFVSLQCREVLMLFIFPMFLPLKKRFEVRSQPRNNY